MIWIQNCSETFSIIFFYIVVIRVFANKNSTFLHQHINSYIYELTQPNRHDHLSHTYYQYFRYFKVELSNLTVLFPKTLNISEINEQGKLFQKTNSHDTAERRKSLARKNLFFSIENISLNLKKRHGKP